MNTCGSQVTQAHRPAGSVPDMHTHKHRPQKNRRHGEGRIAEGAPAFGMRGEGKPVRRAFGSTIRRIGRARGAAVSKAESGDWVDIISLCFGRDRAPGTTDTQTPGISAAIFAAWSGDRF